MEIFKKKTFWYAIITLLVFFTDIWVYFYLKNSPEAFAGAKLPAEHINLEKPNDDPAPIIFDSTVTQTPEKDLGEIKQRAQNLSQKDIQMLAHDAVNTQVNQDQRFKSVYLLAQNGTVPFVLKEIITTPIAVNISDREQDFEHILRAQAIEGLENGNARNISRQILQELMESTDNTFLLDRLSRAKSSLDGLGDSSEVQDNRELEKIIEN